LERSTLACFSPAYPVVTSSRLRVVIATLKVPPDRIVLNGHSTSVPGNREASAYGVTPDRRRCRVRVELKIPSYLILLKGQSTGVPQDLEASTDTVVADGKRCLILLKCHIPRYLTVADTALLDAGCALDLQASPDLCPLHELKASGAIGLHPAAYAGPLRQEGAAFLNGDVASDYRASHGAGPVDNDVTNTHSAELRRAEGVGSRNIRCPCQHDNETNENQTE
jgi:hypothetical protein